MKKNQKTTIQDPSGLIARIARIREAANLIIEKELHARGLTGIVPAHGSVLSFLFSQKESVPIKSLVQRSGRVKSTVTGIVNTLERHGYLFKHGCDRDARSVRIGLTDKGWAMKRDFEAISDTLLGRVYGGMPQGDRERLMKPVQVNAIKSDKSL
jgi:DNA-binding MarR family transcriptional regulator